MTKKPDDQPAPGDRYRAAVVECDEVRRQAAGEDRDDRERDGEVREAAHLAEQHLGIAETVELCARPRRAGRRRRGAVAHMRLLRWLRVTREANARAELQPRCSCRFGADADPRRAAEDVESGAVDTVIACFTDMQGRLMGKRLDADFFLAEHDGGPRGRGLQLPARARDGDGSGARLRDRELGARLRRLRPPARPRRRCAASRGTRRRRWCSATSSGTTARRSRRRRARC